MGKIIKGPWSDDPTPDAPVENRVKQLDIILRPDFNIEDLLAENKVQLRRANSIVAKQKAAAEIILRRLLGENAIFKEMDIAAEAIKIYEQTHGYDGNSALTFGRTGFLSETYEGFEEQLSLMRLALYSAVHKILMSGLNTSNDIVHGALIVLDDVLTDVNNVLGAEKTTVHY